MACALRSLLSGPLDPSAGQWELTGAEEEAVPEAALPQGHIEATFGRSQFIMVPVSDFSRTPGTGFWVATKVQNTLALAAAEDPPGPQSLKMRRCLPASGPFESSLFSVASQPAVSGRMCSRSAAQAGSAQSGRRQTAYAPHCLAFAAIVAT